MNGSFISITRITYLKKNRTQLQVLPLRLLSFLPLHFSIPNLMNCGLSFSFKVLQLDPPWDPECVLLSGGFSPSLMCILLEDTEYLKLIVGATTVR